MLPDDVNFIDVKINFITVSALPYLFIFCFRLFPCMFLPPIYAVAVFKFWGPGPFFYMRGPACERREQLGVWGALKIFRFWSNSGHFGAIWNNFGTYLTGCFWRYGWDFFYFDLIKTILGDTWDNFETSYRILLDILTNALHWGVGKSARPFLGMKSARPRAMAPCPPPLPPPLKPPLHIWQFIVNVLN